MQVCDECANEVGINLTLAADFVFSSMSRAQTHVPHPFTAQSSEFRTTMSDTENKVSVSKLSQPNKY